MWMPPPPLAKSCMHQLLTEAKGLSCHHKQNHKQSCKYIVKIQFEGFIYVENQEFKIYGLKIASCIKIQFSSNGHYSELVVIHFKLFWWGGVASYLHCSRSNTNLTFKLWIRISDILAIQCMNSYETDFHCWQILIWFQNRIHSGGGTRGFDLQMCFCCNCQRAFMQAENPQNRFQHEYNPRNKLERFVLPCLGFSKSLLFSS